MIPAPVESRGAARLCAGSLLLCSTLALANLPASDFPVGWLAALVLPGALLGSLPPMRSLWLRIPATILLQVLGLALALQYAGSLSRPAALACTILPPLAFVSLRQQDTDGALALFLSFCVLLVGIILDGVHAPLVFAYGLTACVTLRSTAHLAACRVSRATQRPATARSAAVLASGLALALPCLLAGFAVDRTIGLLPSPHAAGVGPAVTNGDAGLRRPGLDDDFVLGGGRALANLHGEQLVRVRSVSGRASVAHDLYLRSGFFAHAGIDHWEIGRIEARRVERGAIHQLREPQPDADVQVLEIERFAGARNFVFVPPGATELGGLDVLYVDERREWLRQPAGLPAGDSYEVAYQDLPMPRADVPLAERAGRLGLLTLPTGMERAPFLALLDEWGVPSSPQEAMEAIAAGLASRCRYDRIEPTGPYAHALENFLFAEGSRRGYCMYFASAAALMLRLRGIACRIGVGLYGGDADRDERGARIFGSQHAHAWVEVPFEGRGYVVFDPTPPAERGQSTPSRPDDTGQLDPAQAAATAANGDPWRAVLEFVLQPWLLLVALLLAIGSTLWPTGPARRPAPLLPPVARSARRLLARLLRALAVAGHRRADGDTLELYAHRLAANGCLSPEIARAFVVYQEVRFGGRPFDDARAAELLLAVHAAERLPAAATAAQAVPAAGQT